MASFTVSQLHAVAIIPMITGCLSVIGSVTIVVMLLRNRKKRLSTTYRRLVFGMSTIDIFYSLGYAATTLPTPSGYPITTAWLSIGSTASCTIQGLMIYIGFLGVPTYNCMLSFYYLFTITFNVREKQMASYFEPYFHLVPILFLVITGVVLLVTNSFNPSGTVCMIAAYPRGCTTNPNVECVRGEYAPQFLLYFSGIPIMIIFCCISICMIIIYCSARKREVSARKRIARQLNHHRNHQPSASCHMSLLAETSMVERLSSSADDVESTSRSFDYNNIWNSNNNINNSSNNNLRLAESSTTSIQNEMTTNLIDQQLATASLISPRIARLVSAETRNRQALLIQCTLYVSAYFITWIFSIMFRLHILLATTSNDGNNGGDDETSNGISYTLWILTQIFTPLQGFFNFLVFIRPRISALKQIDPTLTLLKAMWLTITTRDLDLRKMKNDLRRKRKGCINNNNNNNTDRGGGGAGGSTTSLGMMMAMTSTNNNNNNKELLSSSATSSSQQQHQYSDGSSSSFNFVDDDQEQQQQQQQQQESDDHLEAVEHATMMDSSSKSIIWFASNDEEEGIIQKREMTTTTSTTDEKKEEGTKNVYDEDEDDEEEVVVFSHCEQQQPMFVVGLNNTFTVEEGEEIVPIKAACIKKSFLDDDRGSDVGRSVRNIFGRSIRSSTYGEEEFEGSTRTVEA